MQPVLVWMGRWVSLKPKTQRLQQIGLECEGFKRGTGYRMEGVLIDQQIIGLIGAPC